MVGVGGACLALEVEEEDCGCHCGEVVMALEADGDGKLAVKEYLEAMHCLWDRKGALTRTL